MATTFDTLSAQGESIGGNLRSPIPSPAAESNRIGVSRWERLGQILMVALLIIGLPMAYQRAVDNGPDLAGFCEAGRYILDHGAREPRSTLARYWPSADVPWVVFALLPISVAAVLWYAIGCATWLALLQTICCRLLPGQNLVAKRHATLTAGLLAMPLVIDGMCLGSFHVLMVWLMILGLDRALSGKEGTGGLLLGTAAWLKLLPLLGVGFLLYQRRWKGAVIALATVIVLDVGLSVAAYGPAGAWREHVLWWEQGATGTANRQLALSRPTDEDRLTNQSVAVTLRRLLTSLGSLPAARSQDSASATPVALAEEQMYEREFHLKARRQVQLADLTPGQLQAVFLATMGLLALGVAVYCRPRKSEGAEGRQDKIVMITLATLWFSPVVWSYHFVAATPVLAVLLLRGRYRWQLVVPVVGLWLGAFCLLKFEAARAAGVLLWMTLLLGAAFAGLPVASESLPGDAATSQS